MLGALGDVASSSDYCFADEIIVDQSEAIATLWSKTTRQPLSAPADAPLRTRAIYCARSMKISFENAPLVEVIAELRWGLPELSTQPAAGTSIQITAPSTSDEGFFTLFSTEIAAEGFRMAERLVPAGFPAFPFQPVYRFRRVTPDAGSTLYQLGANIFSAHATPPYRSWHEFEPVLTYGIEALLKTRDDQHKATDFSTASLRYINAFGDQLIQNKPAAQFMSEILGISIALPEPLRRVLDPNIPIEPNMRLTFATTNGYQMVLSIANGFVNQRAALIMDSTVRSSNPIPPKKDDILGVFNAAHSILHDSFVDMTTKIHDLMKPRGNSA